MINIIKQSGKDTAYVTDFVADTTADIENLPTYPQVSKGSSVIVIETGDVYMLGGDNTWKKL